MRVEQELGDLDRVERGALDEVVAGEEEHEAVLRGAVGADAADEHLVGLRRRARRRHVDDAHRRRAAQQLGRLLRRRAASSSSTQTASAWPTRTGTRTVVALIGSSGSSRIFCVSARIFDSSSVSSPSQLQSIARLCSSCGSARSCSIRCAPAPDTDW